jgi:hypothetical protein
MKHFLFTLCHCSSYDLLLEAGSYESVASNEISNLMWVGLAKLLDDEWGRFDQSTDHLYCLFEGHLLPEILERLC